MDCSLESFVVCFKEFGDSFDIRNHAKCAEICRTYDISPDDFCSQWMAYKSEKKTQKLDDATIDALERIISENTAKAKITKGYRTMQRSSESTMNNGIKSPFTPKSSKKRPFSTPDSSRKMRIVANGDSLMGTPVRIEQGNTPSGKYSSRTNMGDVIASNCSDAKTNWRRNLDGNPVAVSCVCPEVSTGDFKYMHQGVDDKVAALNRMITKAMEDLKVKDAEEFSGFGRVFQEPRQVVGRICCDGEKQVFLEEHLTGLVLPIDLSRMTDCFLVPGQIVGFECTNPTGKCFSVTKFLEIPLPPPANVRPSRAVSLIAAAGPFSTEDGNFEPLEDLMKKLEKETPDVCLLFGPFVDSNMAEEKPNEDYESLLENIFNDFSEMAERLAFKFVIVPSQRDFLGEHVYPQPPFGKISKNVLCVSDPCTLDVGGVVVGSTSTDVLLHMNKEAVSRSQLAVDRLSKLLHCLLTQRSYYPLYPPSPEVNLDLGLFEEHGGMPAPPRILITPSELKGFVKVVGETTCINPGRLAKRQAGGTYCRVNVPPSIHGDFKSQVVEAEVVRI